MRSSPMTNGTGPAESTSNATSPVSMTVAAMSSSVAGTGRARGSHATRESMPVNASSALRPSAASMETAPTSAINARTVGSASPRSPMKAAFGWLRVRPSRGASAIGRPGVGTTRGVDGDQENLVLGLRVRLVAALDAHQHHRVVVALGADAPQYHVRPGAAGHETDLADVGPGQHMGAKAVAEPQSRRLDADAAVTKRQHERDHDDQEDHQGDDLDHGEPRTYVGAQRDECGDRADDQHQGEPDGCVPRPAWVRDERRGHRRHAAMSVMRIARAPTSHRLSMSGWALRRGTMALTADQSFLASGDTIGPSRPGVKAIAASSSTLSMS